MSEPTAKLRKGLAHCPVCNKVIRPASRAVPHPETPECKATVVRLAYLARGWGETRDATQAKILDEAGVPVEWAFGGTHVEQLPTGEKGRFGEPLYKDEWRNHLVAFTPVNALRASGLLVRTQLPAEFRRRAIKALWDRPDLMDAIDAVKRLSSTGYRTPIWQAVVAAEEAKGVEAAQVVRHGNHDSETDDHSPATLGACNSGEP